jgi:ketosteroid isomerase-like protein
MDNISTVQEMYAAFGRGDIPAILERLDPGVAWDPDADGSIPWIVAREGRDGVAEFFAGLDALEFHTFEPRNFLAGGDQVAVTLKIGVTVKATGESLPEDELHLWTFGADGRVTELRHYVDTAAHAAAALVHH